MDEWVRERLKLDRLFYYFFVNTVIPVFLICSTNGSAAKNWCDAKGMGSRLLEICSLILRILFLSLKRSPSKAEEKRARSISLQSVFIPCIANLNIEMFMSVA